MGKGGGSWFLKSLDFSSLKLPALFVGQIIFCRKIDLYGSLNIIAYIVNLILIHGIVGDYKNPHISHNRARGYVIF